MFFFPRFACRVLSWSVAPPEPSRLETVSEKVSLLVLPLLGNYIHIFLSISIFPYVLLMQSLSISLVKWCNRLFISFSSSLVFSSLLLLFDCLSSSLTLLSLLWTTCHGTWLCGLIENWPLIAVAFSRRLWLEGFICSLPSFGIVFLNRKSPVAKRSH